MDVTFRRTGEGRYAIAVHRGDGSPIMHMPHGPGYDPWLPHDLAHFLVERHFAIAHGVFGQLAAGGDAGTFFTIPHRRRDASRVLSKRLGMLGREDTARSERLASACTAAWHRRHGRRWEFSELVDIAELGDRREELLDVVDAEAARWHALQVGGSLTFAWPAHLTPRPGRSHRGRRQSRDRAIAVAPHR